jgi:SUR7/PalI family
VYLWNYCSWNGNDKYSFCSPRKSEFWFNPVEVWGLNGTGAENLFPKELKDGLDTYKDVSKYMFIVYVIALVATIVELLIGVSAMFSRWGSFVTTFFAVVRRLPIHFDASILIAILDCFHLHLRSLPHIYDPLRSPQDRLQPCLQSLQHQRQSRPAYAQNHLAGSPLLRSGRILLVYQYLLLQWAVALQG